MAAPIAGQVRELWIYPVKACRGIPLEKATLVGRGLDGDRRWMIVDARGRFLTQREEPRLALVAPTLAADGLRLSLGHAGTVALPLDDEGEPMTVRVWRDEVEAVAPDPLADQALSLWLGRPVRIVRFPDKGVRPCDPTYAPPGTHTAFADGFPVLITNEASLQELNSALIDRAEPPVPMTRFRPNIVVGGAPARAEDESDEITIAGRARLALVKRCDRCVVTTVDQATGEKAGKEPLATLTRIRRNERTGGAWFGQNAVPLLGPEARAELRVGDPCTFMRAQAAPRSP